MTSIEVRSQRSFKATPGIPKLAAFGSNYAWLVIEQAGQDDNGLARNTQVLTRVTGSTTPPVLIPHALIVEPLLALACVSDEAGTIVAVTSRLEVLLITETEQRAFAPPQSLAQLLTDAAERFIATSPFVQRFCEDQRIEDQRIGQALFGFRIKPMVTIAAGSNGITSAWACVRTEQGPNHAAFWRWSEAQGWTPHLDQVESIGVDPAEASNSAFEVYPQFDGEDDTFDITDLKGIEHCSKLN